jgi:hypothetical protein
MANRRHDRAHRVALAGILIGLSTAFLYIAALIPTSYIGTVAVASLFVCVAIVEISLTGGVFVFAGTAILGAFLVPLKSAVLLYVLFLGYYPIVKSLAERLKSRVYEWIIKLVVMNGALAVMLFVFESLIFSGTFFSNSKPLIFLVFNLCFVVYDLGVSRLIIFYCARISKYSH